VCERVVCVCERVVSDKVACGKVACGRDVGDAEEEAAGGRRRECTTEEHESHTCHTMMEGITLSHSYDNRMSGLHVH